MLSNVLHKSYLKLDAFHVKGPMLCYEVGSIIGQAFKNTRTFNDAAQIFSHTLPRMAQQCPSVILSSAQIAKFKAFYACCFAFSTFS